MFTAQSYDPFFFTRMRHEHPQLHPNHIGLVRLAHAASFDDLEGIDRELEVLTARRRQVLDRLSDYRRRLWPGLGHRHHRRVCRDEENPLPPAAVDAEPLWGDELRRVAVAILGRHGALPLRELHGLIHRYGYVIESVRPVQRLADAVAFEVRHGRLERLERGVYGPVPGAGDRSDQTLRRARLPWRSPVEAAASRGFGDPLLEDRAIDPAVRDDPERWSGRGWPESAQAGGEWCAGRPDPFVAELAEDLDATVAATRQRLADLHAQHLGPPPPRYDPRRPAENLHWARTYPPRTPSPPHDDPPDTSDRTDDPAPPGTSCSTIGNDSSTNRSRWSERGTGGAGGEEAAGTGDGGAGDERSGRPSTPE